MAETVNDILGKGFKYEERTEVENLVSNLSGTKVALVGVANWGPIGIPTQVINSFKNYFGSEINRDTLSKDYSGMVAASVIGVVPSCYFTRVADGTEQKSSLKITKASKAAIFTGQKNVQGKSLKVAETCNLFKCQINAEPDSVVSITMSPRCAALESGELPTSLTDPLAVNFNVGDYIEFYVDGISYQYIINSSSDILCKLVGVSKFDDSHFGGKALDNLVNYVDRIIYAIKTNIIGGGDVTRIIRKVGTNKISINSNERGSSSVLKITNFPVVFPSASSTSPLMSSSANSSAESVINEIKNSITALAQAYVSSDKKFEIQTLLKGASAHIKVLPKSILDRNADFDTNMILDAGTFSTPGLTSWVQVSDGLLAALAFGTGQVITTPSGTVGAAATAGHQGLGLTGKSGSSDTGLAGETTYNFTIAVDGGTAQVCSITTSSTTPVTFTALIALLDAEVTGATFSIVGGDLVATSSTTGATSAILLGNGATSNLFAAITGFTAFATAVAGTNATSGYANIHFATGIVATDPCQLPAGTYLLSLNVDGSGASDRSIVLQGYETWQQVAEVIDALTGLASSIVGGDLRISSETTGASSSVVIAEGSGAATGVSITSGTGVANIVTSGTAKLAQSVSQMFAVSANQAYQKGELYFVPSGGSYTSGIIKVVVYKGHEVLASQTITAITNPIRVTFYLQGAGSDYRISWQPVVINTATTLTIDNLFLGLERATPNNDLLDFLGVVDNNGAYDLTYDAVLRPTNIFSGQDSNLDMGTLEAVYTGSDGNNVYMVKQTQSGIETMTFYSDTQMLGKIVNFSYTVADDFFFGNSINNDSKIKQYVLYILPTTPPAVIETIPDGTYRLSGGSSGISGVVDAQYATALDAYTNLDIFDVDIVCVVGNSTSIVISKIQEVCERRKDCFGVIDPPEIVAGKPGGVATGGADAMIYWHNGQMPSLLNMKLDSKYLVTYFPWVLKTTKSVVNAEQWMPPSISAVPIIVSMDKEKANIFNPPAGITASITDISDIAYYLDDTEKGRIYDDNIGNNINPIVFTSKNGFFIDGQKTCQRARNAYNRIDIMRVALFMKRHLQDMVPFYFYKPIIKDTRDDFVAAVKKEIMEPLVKKNKIKPEPDYTIDMSNNTDIIEASQGMVAVIEWTPIKSLEKIKVISYMKDTQVIVQF